MSFRRPWSRTRFLTQNIQLEPRIAPAVFVVTSGNDEGPGTLRQAILDSNANNQADTITFAANVTSVTIGPPVNTLKIGTDPNGLAILGPGPGLLTVGVKSIYGGNSPLFQVDVPGTTAVTFSGFTLDVVSGKGIINVTSVGSLTLSDMVMVGKSWNSNVNAVSQTGGQIHFDHCTVEDFEPGSSGFLYVGAATTVTFTDSVFRNNRTSDEGGVVYAPWGATISATRTSFIGNRSSDAGGVIAGANVQLTLDRCEFVDNQAWFQGGAIRLSAGSIVANDCLFAGNRADNFYAMGNGGVIYSDYFTPITIVNSTLSDNVALNMGGAIVSTGNLTLENCTLSGNTAAYYGGIQGSNVTLRSSVVAGNVRTSSKYNPDLAANSVIATNSVIGVTDLNITTLTATNSLTGTLGKPLDPRLVPLPISGGLTRTRAPYFDSPLLDAGANTLGLAYDQRGVGFPRVIGAAADIGAHEGVSPLPFAKAGPVARVVSPGVAPQIVVTYTDATGIDVSTLGAGDLRIIGPTGDIGTASLVSVDSPGNGPVRVATYSYSPVGGTWQSAQTGTYTVRLAAAQAFDIDGNSAVETSLATFFVDVGSVIVVDRISDDSDGNVGPGQRSIREALAAANANKNRIDTITFDPTVFTNSSTITLLLGALSITDRVVVNGPAAGLTIDARGSSRVLEINVTNTAIDTNVTINGLTLTKGFTSASGGAVRALAGTVLLNNVVVSQSNAGTEGGGVYAATAFTMQGGALRGNTAVRGGGAVMGFFGGTQPYHQFYSMTIENNVATEKGGGLYSNSGVDVEESLVIGNRAPVGGGLFATSAYLANSTVFGNTATDSAGGISSTYLTIRNSTVAGNTATVHTGGIAQSGSVAGKLESTIVSNNFALYHPDIAGTFTATKSLVRDPGIAVITGVGNLIGLDPQLLPLANNGGPTLSLLPAATSPVRDAGFSLPQFTNDQRGPGFLRVVGSAPDIGAIERQDTLPAIPITATVSVQGGQVQRSQVFELSVTFSDDVTFPNGAATAFKLEAVGGGKVDLDLTPLGNSITLRFLPGPLVTTGGSLVDGRYTLTLVAAEISGGLFDGNGDGTTGDNQAVGVHRLFGDANGDATVSATDYLAFRLEYLTTGATFDSDGDGQVTAADLLAFRLRFLLSV